MSARIRLLCAAAVLCSSAAYAAYAVTRDEMVKFTEEAAAFAQQVGKDAALKEFNDRGGKFWRHDGELYIFAYTLDGVNLALPNNPAMVGKSLIDMKDPDGTPVIRKLLATAKEKKKGFLEYKWANPASKKIEKKVAMVVLMGDWVLGSGYYLKE